MYSSDTLNRYINNNLRSINVNFNSLKSLSVIHYRTSLAQTHAQSNIQSHTRTVHTTHALKHKMKKSTSLGGCEMGATQQLPPPTLM